MHGNQGKKKQIKKKTKQFLCCTLPERSAVLDLVGARAQGKLGRTWSLVRILPPPLATQPQHTAGWSCKRLPQDLTSTRISRTKTWSLREPDEHQALWGWEATTLRIRTPLLVWTFSHPFFLDDSTGLSHWPQMRARIRHKAPVAGGEGRKVCWRGIRDDHPTSGRNCLNKGPLKAVRTETFGQRGRDGVGVGLQRVETGQQRCL